MPTHPSAHSFKKASRVVSKSRLKGLSLIELMISITVGLLVLLGLIAIYLNASRSNTEFAKMNRQIENGRYALQILREELWHAGFWGEYRMPPSDTATLADPCTTAAGWSGAYRDNVMLVPVQGYGDRSGEQDLSETSCTTPDRVAATDVLIVRYASRCLVGTGCSAIAGVPRFQASLCETDSSDFVLSTDDDELILHAKDCISGAAQRNYVSNLYYVRDHANSAGDGLPTLMRWTYGEAAPQPLVEGIEHLDFEYAIDSDGDGNIDSFTSAPSDTNPDAKWKDVIGVRIHLVARNLEPTPGHTDSKAYLVGTDNPFNGGDAREDPFKRHAYSSFVRLNNPSMRREGTLPSGSNGVSEGESGTDADAPDSGSDATGDAS